MGRLFLEFVDQDASAKYICCCCQCDIASEGCLLWEGYMGALTPAFLFREAVNLEADGKARQEVLSTGQYTLQDIRCRSCCTWLGWRYVTATNHEQKYKEGAVLLQQGALQRISGLQAVASRLPPALVHMAE